MKYLAFLLIILLSSCQDTPINPAPDKDPATDTQTDNNIDSATDKEILEPEDAVSKETSKTDTESTDIDNNESGTDNDANNTDNDNNVINGNQNQESTDNDPTGNEPGNNHQTEPEPDPEDPISPLYIKNDKTIRLMAANITASDNSSYEAAGIRIFKGLKPDIVMIQEFRYFPDLDKVNNFADIDEFVQKTFGPEFTYHRGKNNDSDLIPNGIISRFPIISSGTWKDSYINNRAHEWAKIDIPGDKDLYAISVHMATDVNKRKLEGPELATFIADTVTDDSYVAIGGDFNSQSRTEDLYKALANVVTIAAPFPSDQKGNSNTNLKRVYPFDGVYVSADLHAKEVPVALGSTQKSNGLVFDSRTFSPLSDLEPILATDSKAGKMQHMPVIRDFQVLD